MLTMATRFGAKFIMFQLLRTSARSLCMGSTAIVRGSGTYDRRWPGAKPLKLFLAIGTAKWACTLETSLVEEEPYFIEDMLYAAGKILTMPPAPPCLPVKENKLVFSNVDIIWP